MELEKSKSKKAKITLDIIKNGKNSEKKINQLTPSEIVAELTPSEIVAELDKYIIGQRNAKKSVAIALRNRWRRQSVKDNLREEIMPNNIIMIGPTGVGKTEIARRISKLANAPFLKIEASKFTEVGYVGRDVESMVREITDLGVNMVKSEKLKEVQIKAQENAIERILDILLPPIKKKTEITTEESLYETEKNIETREKLKEQLLAGKLDNRTIELDLSTDNTPMLQVLGPVGLEEMGLR